MRLKRTIASMALAGAVALGGLALTTGTAAQAAPARSKPAPVTGAQARPSVAPGSMDKASPQTKPLGTTRLRAVDPLTGKPASALAAPLAGYNSNVDFSTVYNYCQGNLSYTSVVNRSAATQYFEVYLYDTTGATRTYYTSVAANSTAWPYWYGVQGTYYAYLYVWNGSSYAYDEYETSANTCSVSVSLNTNTGYTGYVLLTMTNNGTDYAYLESNELAPYPGSGTYTGLHWDYPAAGGGVVYRYLYVGTGLRYGIFVNLYGANGYTPWYWYGQL